MSLSKFSIRTHRVSSKSDFALLYKQGKIRSYKNLRVRHIKADSENVRCAFVISKKVGNAVFRNRIRRIMREFIFTNCKEFKHNTLMLIQYYPTDKNLFSKDILRKDVQTLLNKAELL